MSSRIIEYVGTPFSEALILSKGGLGPPHAQRRNKLRIAGIATKWHLFMDRFLRIFPPEDSNIFNNSTITPDCQQRGRGTCPD
jgi:hypothetical protein